MSNKLISQFNRLEEQTNTFFSLLEQYSPEQLSFRPNGSEWSMLDVVEHLYTAEKGVNSFFEKYPPNESKFSMSFQSHIKSWLMQYYLKSPSKFKAPSHLPPPKGNVSLADWKKTWQVERKKFKLMIENLNEEKVNASVFKHAVSGPMNMYHVINFNRNHIIHHIHQIKRIQKNSTFPK